MSENYDRMVGLADDLTHELLVYMKKLDLPKELMGGLVIALSRAMISALARMHGLDNLAPARDLAHDLLDRSADDLEDAYRRKTGNQVQKLADNILDLLSQPGFVLVSGQGLLPDLRKLERAELMEYIRGKKLMYIATDVKDTTKMVSWKVFCQGKPEAVLGKITMAPLPVEQRI